MTRIYMIQVADLILNISNWVSSEKQIDDSKLTEAVSVASARLNSIFIAASDSVGIEREQPFLGRSMIV